jgi:hypothetical protein
VRRQENNANPSEIGIVSVQTQIDCRLWVILSVVVGR